ncbi:MAG TPA: DUF362 domain-containing protein [bacterium]|nr:DUF362 domain-containing protein [bacterium]
MDNIDFTPSGHTKRRIFLKNTMLGIAGITLGTTRMMSCASQSNTSFPSDKRNTIKTGKSIVSFVTGNDTRDAAYRSLKPLEDEIMKAIGNKQVVIKVNAGVAKKKHRHESTDVEQIRGILDFFKPVYDNQIIIAEGVATPACSVFIGYENYEYMALEKEYNVKLIDTNDQPTTTKWILAGYHRPQSINIINTFLEPNVYLISACRLKPHGSVIVTLSVKNVVMGSAVCHYKLNTTGKDNPKLCEKTRMHGGAGSKLGRELSYNIFSVADMGVYPDLSVLDGVVAAEGNGPWNATPLEHGVAIASNDCIAADRVGAELMGIDYSELMYLQWCAQAGIGQDDLTKVELIGQDYKRHVLKYKLNKNIEEQRQWIYELRKNLGS